MSSNFWSCLYGELMCESEERTASRKGVGEDIVFVILAGVAMRVDMVSIRESIRRGLRAWGRRSGGKPGVDWLLVRRN